MCFGGFFNPIWAYWACFARGSIGRHQFVSISFIIKDAPPRGTWLRALHWWSKVGRDSKTNYKEEKEEDGKSPAPGGIQPHDLMNTRCVCSTAVLQPQTQIMRKLISTACEQQNISWVRNLPDCSSEVVCGLTSSRCGPIKNLEDHPARDQVLNWLLGTFRCKERTEDVEAIFHLQLVEN